ncbi:hypothetical protein GLOIN_2v1621425 [Rhizophagus clarus]|uniref:Kazal-like domain-containing protein n=1 Tax=Rhizophagus clarus TaxID=94130 RepID=A0A8H3QG32_9GLOM|nr:hypothetical protein GLOIN_2v1621425 [Rhizophagus clarus]
MKFTTILASTLLFFSIIVSKTDASCDDCLTFAQNVVICNNANEDACITSSVQIDDSPPSQPFLIDCCDGQQILYEQCMNGCPDQNVLYSVQSYCPYTPPC